MNLYKLSNVNQPNIYRNQVNLNAQKVSRMQYILILPILTYFDRKLLQGTVLDFRILFSTHLNSVLKIKVLCTLFHDLR